MGIGKSQLEEIVAYLGSDITTFVDNVVKFLSKDYYESINAVYSAMENKHLRQEKNYFPTRPAGYRVAEKSFSEEDFYGRFGNEYGPLNERTDKGPIMVIGDSNGGNSVDFFDTLVEHVNTMERYKAFAKPTKDLNIIFSTRDMAALTAKTGMGNERVLRQLIAHAINGNKIGANTTAQRATSFLLGMLTGSTLVSN